MLVQGTDFHCTTLKNVPVCIPDTQTALAAIQDMQTQVNRLTSSFPGVENNLITVDGRVGPGTATLVSQIGLAAGDLDNVPSNLLQAFQNVTNAMITAYAQEIAAWFSNVADNFDSLYAGYLDRIYGTQAPPVGELSPIEAQVQSIVDQVNTAHSTVFWVAVFGGVALAAGAGLWLLRRRRHRHGLPAARRRHARAFATA